MDEVDTMSAKHQVRIYLTQCGRHSVLIDGTELRRVKSVSFKCESGQPNVVSVELYAESVEVDALACVEQRQSLPGPIEPPDWADLHMATGAALDALCKVPARPAGMTDDQVRERVLHLWASRRDPGVSAEFQTPVDQPDFRRVYPTHYVVNEPLPVTMTVTVAAATPHAVHEHDPEKLAAVEATREKLKQLGD